MHPLIHDWNTIGLPPPPARVLLNDETLRDGLQSPSVTTPNIDRKIEILHLIEALGIDSVDIGLPGAGPHVLRDVECLAKEIVKSKLQVRPNCAARTKISDIKPIVEISQRVGVPIECCPFIGSSAIRHYTEGWSLDQLLGYTEESISFAVREGLPVMYVTEDATRADPETLRQLCTTAIRAGASRGCIADTVGHAIPSGARAVVRFVAQIVAESGDEVGIDWHGHRDRDLAVVNSLAALEAGATRVHATALGIGERVGNTPMELLLVNLVLLGWVEQDLSRLMEYCRAVAETCGVQIPANHAVVGEDAFRTATGVHAAAVLKAFHKSDLDLADAVYSGVPAGLVGRKQVIDVGPMSGRSNVVGWLERHGVTVTEARVDRVLAGAKSSSRVLSDSEIDVLISAAPGEGSG